MSASRSAVLTSVEVPDARLACLSRESSSVSREGSFRVLGVQAMLAGLDFAWRGSRDAAWSGCFFIRRGPRRGNNSSQRFIRGGDSSALAPPGFPTSFDTPLASVPGCRPPASASRLSSMGHLAGHFPFGCLLGVVATASFPGMVTTDAGHFLVSFQLSCPLGLDSSLSESIRVRLFTAVNLSARVVSLSGS